MLRNWRKTPIYRNEQIPNCFYDFPCFKNFAFLLSHNDLSTEKLKERKKWPQKKMSPTNALYKRPWRSAQCAAPKLKFSSIVSVCLIFLPSIAWFNLKFINISFWINLFPIKPKKLFGSMENKHSNNGKIRITMEKVKRVIGCTWSMVRGMVVLRRESRSSTHDLMSLWAKGSSLGLVSMGHPLGGMKMRDER